MSLSRPLIVCVFLGYTACCDWWSVGVILYEMRVGQPPFLANNPADTQMKVCECKYMSEVVIKSSFTSVNFIQFYSIN